MTIILDVQQKLTIEAVESLNYDIPHWFELRLGKITLVRIRCWSMDTDADNEQWDLYSSDSACTLLPAPTFKSVATAIHWYIQNYING